MGKPRQDPADEAQELFFEHICIDVVEPSSGHGEHGPNHVQFLDHDVAASDLVEEDAASVVFRAAVQRGRGLIDDARVLADFLDCRKRELAAVGRQNCGGLAHAGAAGQGRRTNLEPLGSAQGVRERMEALVLAQALKPVAALGVAVVLQEPVAAEELGIARQDALFI